VPSPCPSVGDVNTIQEDAADALHEQSRATPTVIDAVPPPAANDVAELLTVAWQRVVVGLVTVVVVELPHAADNRSAAANGRDADRITARHNAGCQPP
jgi:hypothetical protein